MTTINVSAQVDKTVKFLDSFRKQIPFTVSVALNKTALKVKERETHEIKDVFDRPTPFISNSVFMKPSNKATLTAKVGIKDQGRVPAAKVLASEISGGQRRLKAFEKALIASGKPYVIENVPGAPLINPVQLCGSAFGLKVRRHRLFESNLELQGTQCFHKEQGRPIGIYGSMRDEIPGGGHTAKTMPEAEQAMGIDWMIWGELVEAIPPAYTREIGKQLFNLLQ